jgi:hypothetical protein
MAWWNCCCDATCLIHEDGFGRTPGTPLRGRWCDEEGDYEIAAAIIDEQCGGARCLVANALAILNVPHPVPEGSMIASLVTCDEVVDSGDKYRVLVNVDRTASGDPLVCDSENYYFVEFEVQGIANSVLRLGIVSGGVEAILKEDDIIGLTGDTRTVWAFITDNVLCGGVTNAVLSLVSTVHGGLFANGYYSGFSLSEVGMTIRKFSFFRYLLESAPFGVCNSCICTCDGIDGSVEWGPTLVAKIYVHPDDVPCIRLDKMEQINAPCEIVLQWNRLDGVWEGDGFCCLGDEYFSLEVSCGSNGYGGTLLNLNVSIGCSAQLSFPAYSTDCSQPCAMFGPITVVSSNLLCFCTTVPIDPMNAGNRGSCRYLVEVCALDA